MSGFFDSHSLIGRRLISYTVLFSSCLALIFTLFQVNVEYKNELQKHRLNQALIESSLLHSLAQSVWTFDDAQIYSQLQGMVNIPMIERVSLRLPDNVRFNVGQVLSMEVDELSFDVVFAENISQDTKLGVLKVYAGMDQTYLHLLKYSAIVLFFNVTKTALVIMFMFYLIDRLIGRHLFKISRHLSQYQDSAQAKPLVLSRCHHIKNDEIELVVNALNKMQKNIQFEKDRAKSEAQKREALQQQVIEQKEQVLTLERNVGLAEMAITLGDELNRPLHSICDYSQMCRKMLSESIVEPHLLLNLIEKLNNQANNAINILERSQNVRINTQPMLACVDINRIIRQVIALLHYNLNDAGIMLTHHCSDSELLIVADELQLEQVLINLIRNAIDALVEQPQGIRLIEITAWHEESAVRLRVEDNGAGFSVDAASELFKPFFTTKQQGIGVGLSISQNLITAMNGSITARNRLDRGACFTISLPQAKECSYDERVVNY